MAYGGMAPTTSMPKKTLKYLKNKPWTNETIEVATQSLLEDFPLAPDAPGAMVQYRKSLASSFLFKAYLTLGNQSGLVQLNPNELSAVQKFTKEPVQSHQLFEIKHGESATKPVGSLLKHRSADKQACGEALYIDDMPNFEQELHLAFVISTKAHAKILNIDFGDALTMDGVEKIITAKDVPQDRNTYTMVIRPDEEVFAKDKVNCVGQVIAAVLAKTQDIAKKASKMVKVQYEELPAIITIEEAIEANSFFAIPNSQIKKGNPAKIMESCDHVIKGTMRTGAQEHFYLETQATIAVPTKEDGEMHIYSSTQSPTDTQRLVAHVLGVPMSRVVCHVKRLGGGFGGKETRSCPVSMVCALAAAMVKQPVRAVLDRDEDMLMSGHRHPFKSKYKVGFNKEGRILALDIDLYNNAGYSLDLSFAVMEKSMLHSDAVYQIENVDIRGHCCKTNLPSNTAFRAFGGPQGMMTAETWMDRIANVVQKDPAEVRYLNMYKEGGVTHFNQKMVNCTLEKCWQECMEQSSFEKQRQSIAEFNKLNRWKKRGISIIPVKFGIAYEEQHLNQSGALVQIYSDGSVLLTHGGTEMGQGLHVKMIQVASQVLEVAHEKIHIAETATDKVPNTPPTAASLGSDLNGMAIFNACTVLHQRLQPYRDKYPEEKWEKWVERAFFAAPSCWTST